MERSRRIVCLFVLACIGSAQEWRGASVFTRADGGTIQGTIDGERVVMGEYHALLIAVADYRKPLDALDTPLDDVAKLKHLLETRFGFLGNVTTLKDREATRGEILRKLDEYGEALGPGDNLLVYFAGHGKADGTQIFWIPWIPPEKDATDRSEWVTAADVKAKLAAIRAQHVLLVCDSCYAGAGELTRAPVLLEGTGSPYLIRKIRDPSYQVITSGGNEPVADSGPSGLSRFAYFFTDSLEKMRQPWKTAMQIYNEVSPFVGNESSGEQMPQYGTIRGTIDKGGEFVFVRTDTVAVAAPDVIDDAGWPPGYRRPANLERRGDFWRFAGDDVDMVLIYPIRERFRDRIEHPYLIDRFEVTVARFRESKSRLDELRYWGHPRYSGESQPVVGVRFDHARDFALSVKKDLPTEAEWEYAAAWGPGIEKARRYPWGDAFDNRVTSVDFPPPVDGLELDISAWGVRGLGSGVREWCLPAGRDSPSGVVRGASQVPAGRKSFLQVPATRAADRARAVDRRHEVGFRCVYRLRRLY